MKETGRKARQLLRRLVPGLGDGASDAAVPPPEALCRHAANLKSLKPKSTGCEECLASGDSWVHLRMCLLCGHVGCCDSSRGKHATQHFRDTNHALVRSLERGETWGWCYFDQQELDGKYLPPLLRK
jgi:uncharacterized UBP type Zn finger protein